MKIAFAGEWRGRKGTVIRIQADGREISEAREVYGNGRPSPH